jgi:hypothetical protein
LDKRPKPKEIEMRFDICNVRSLYGPVKEDEMGRARSRNGGEEGCIGGKARSLGRPRRRWVNNTNVDLREDGIVW